MVTVYNMNIGQCPGNPPPRNAGDTEREVAGGPKYPKAEVLALLADIKVRPWTKGCVADIAKLGLDISEVAILATEAVSHGRFKGSVWCMQSPDGPSAICDAYVLKRKEWNNAAKKELDCEYYVKLAIGRSGAILLLVSCHT